ncbi:hypothetical protein PV08_01726 [Exophiala spinifera]|uniref:3-methylaspartate ammonia-lyase n=1 Tax=Exophiala spinifera TaxID=91928 RepID=A0A0D1Z0L1_9EURO|nr:uncharacterized protein PV08_01726 [Exophiala spinifera]KIW21146.1 hypothetical protein PV08_01726 [Exophiala spinifera]
MPSSRNDELRLFTPVGMLGYGYSHDVFWSTIEQGVDAIIADSGSTDSGPSKLALGTMSCPREAYQHDLEPFIAAAHSHKVPVIIGSAGGDGSNDHVDTFADIIQDIVKKNGYRPMKLVKIYSEINKEVVQEKLSANLIVPCGSAVPPLQENDVRDASVVVAQMGLEPYRKAMEEFPDFDIIIGGRTYDPSPYAAFCIHKGFDDLGIAYHMGKILECGGLCAKPKSREAMAIVRRDHFDIVPNNPTAVCTPVSVAAHTLYEKTRPDILVGPGGTLDLRATTYEQLLDGRTVRVRGAIFTLTSPGEYTIKLEGARIAGYRSAFFGGFSDPVLIAQLDVFIENVRAHVASVCKFEHELKLTAYGIGDHISMFKGVKHASEQIPASAAIAGEAKAATQEQATRVINATRVACMHASYPGQMSTSGNLAMSCGSFDVPMGRVCEFCIYHLMTVDDPVAHFPRKMVRLHGPGTAASSTPVKVLAGLTEKTVPKATQTKVENNNRNLSPPPRDGYQYLAELASVVRSKNAGPYEVTFDIMFDKPENYAWVKETCVLSSSSVACMYGIDESEVLAAVWWEPALAFKATLKRPLVSGGFGETDTHGSCQHVRLMYLEVPKPKIGNGRSEH